MITMGTGIVLVMVIETIMMKHPFLLMPMEMDFEVQMEIVMIQMQVSFQ